jgi:hypothetical protein
MPNVVKGSKQHRMAVVPYRPRYRIAISLLGLVLLAVAMSGAYFAGEYFASRSYSVSASDNVLLRKTLVASQAELEQLRGQITVVGRTSEMDQAAVKEIQVTVSQLRQRVMQLEQDIIFYRQVMSPEAAQPGVIIAELSIHPTSSPRVYRYKAVFRQAGTGDDMLEGSVSISLLGKLEGEDATIAVEDVFQGGEGYLGKLGFRYFQNLEGEILIPEGFSPAQVVIDAESHSPAENVTSRMFNWSLSEG